MKKTYKRVTAVLAAAMMAAVMVMPVNAAQAALLQTKDGKTVEDATLKSTDLSQYSDFFAALGATDEQQKSIYLAGMVNLKVGDTYELLLAQPARVKNANASLELLVGKQAAVSITGPADSKTVKNGDMEYLPLTITAEAEGTDIYVASIAPYDICAYQFVVGSGKGVTNTNPRLYQMETVVTEAATIETEAVKTINYNPAPVGVTLANSGSNLLSQGGVRVDGKQVNGVNIYGHAQYSPSAIVSTPKQVRIGMLNEETIITIDNNARSVATSEPKAVRSGMLNEETIITINNNGTSVAATEEKAARAGMLNEESIITIDNNSTSVATSEEKVARIGMLNAEEIITVNNNNTQVAQSEQETVRSGMLNAEEIIQIL